MIVDSDTIADPETFDRTTDRANSVLRSSYLYHCRDKNRKYTK